MEYFIIPSECSPALMVAHPSYQQKNTPRNSELPSCTVSSLENTVSLYDTLSDTNNDEPSSQSYSGHHGRGNSDTQESNDGK